MAMCDIIIYMRRSYMKKFMMTICLCAVFLVSGIMLTSCGDKQLPTTYTITLPTSTDYTIESDRENAEAGQEITLTITILNNELVLENVFANNIACEENYNGTFSFTMPAENVTISVQTSQIQEVLSTNFVWFDDDNLYTITEDGDGTYDW